MWIYISHYSLLGSSVALLLGLLLLDAVDLSKGSFELFQLGRSQAVELLSEGGANRAVELGHAPVGHVSHILEVVLDAFQRELD